MSGLLVFFCNIFFLSVSSYFDIKKRIIPNRCVLFMLAGFFAVNAADVIITDVSPGVMMIAAWALSSLCVLLLFLPAELLSRKKLGSGDKNVLMVLSLSLGVWGSISVVFWMLAGAGGYYVILHYVKRRQLSLKKQKTVPMAPFILGAYSFVYFF